MICTICEHGPHTIKPCSTCGCTQWMNTETVTARSLLGLNNFLGSEIPKIVTLLADIGEIMLELHPDIVEKINAKRAELRAQKERENADKETGTSNAAIEPDAAIGG